MKEKLLFNHDATYPVSCGTTEKQLIEYTNEFFKRIVNNINLKCKSQEIEELEKFLYVDNLKNQVDPLILRCCLVIYHSMAKDLLEMKSCIETFVALLRSINDNLIDFDEIERRYQQIGDQRESFIEMEIKRKKELKH